MSSRLRIAAVEPYFGGSHRAFLESLQRHSRHDIRLVTLPARLWKWRVRGGALGLAPQLDALDPVDAMLCSDYVNLADLRALCRPALRTVPVLYYLHENQLTYPLSPDETFDPYFGFTNILSALAADAVVFNSEFHRDAFLERLPDFLPRLPDYAPREIVETLRSRAEVIPVGLELADLDARRPPPPAEPGPPRILWNHRWDHDKDPERFFAALDRLAAAGERFVVDVIGTAPRRPPAVFAAARRRLGEHLGAFGTLPTRDAYVACLWRADVVVSTARQEFFGIAVAEAVWCGARPVLPRALVYPEVYATATGPDCLYTDDADLDRRLVEALHAPAPVSQRAAWRERLRRFDAPRVAARFDERFEALVGDRR